MRSAALPRFSSKIPGFISYVILTINFIMDGSLAVASPTACSRGSLSMTMYLMSLLVLPLLPLLPLDCLN